MSGEPETRGVFIAFEGPEGSGKTTQLGRLAARLEALGQVPLTTKEPGGTAVGERLRALVLDPALRMHPETELLLYAASRAELVASVLKPALAAGRVVLCDRFTGATVAYQGEGRGLPKDWIGVLNARVTGGLKPHLTLLFDLPPEVGLARVARRGARDRLEQAAFAFHERVRRGFLQQAEQDPSWHVLDASRPEEEVAGAVWRLVAPLLRDRGALGR
ncbi:dTMP kinase [Truepera radiovictrix]|uniref:Thymidylate kinase n=1 Tax=Truepera radiovictrix (strain DSM 17093 / CIP 108686 / LMG 22925 / RQ-24) TaxID=649638 RepID=D7CST7_TRURR|nr:dTMP kinase [Truepera radiovictrix]ADI13704.1 thymidylate kinase [Truepera radiovictrix DSM 17093]WMT57731.1 dTMP kinase [Truepera radiovictrix]